MVLFGLGGLSTDRYIRALAVCNDLAQLASQGSDAEFIDRVTMLMCLKKHWMDGRADAKVICGSGEAEDETVDLTALSLEVENISTESVLSQDSVTRSQPVIVLCSKNGTADRSAAENLHQQTEHYGIFPSLLTVPFASEFHIMYKKISNASMYWHLFIYVFTDKCTGLKTGPWYTYSNKSGPVSISGTKNRSLIFTYYHLLFCEMC